MEYWIGIITGIAIGMMAAMGIAEIIDDREHTYAWQTVCIVICMVLVMLVAVLCI